MYPVLEGIFDDAETRYLKSEELALVSQYVESLPLRLETYKLLRDKEIVILQQVADRLQVEMPEVSDDLLERSIKSALLLLRGCAMAMLLNDDALLQERLLGWLEESMAAYNTRTVDTALHRLLNQYLTQTFNTRQVSVLAPYLKKAQMQLLQPAAAPRS